MENNNQEEKKDEFEHTFKTIEARKVVLKDNQRFFKRSLLNRFVSKIIEIIVIIFLLPYAFIFLGFRRKNAKNIFKVKTGSIVVANHIHPVDAFILGSSLFPKKFYITMLETNMGLPGASIIETAGAVPIPSKKSLLERFSTELVESVTLKKTNVALFPEASLRPYCDHIRQFRKGAFRYAIAGNAPIIPMVWTFHKPRGLYKLYKKKPCLHLNVLEPYYPDLSGTRYEAIDKAMKDVHKIMEDFFNSHSEIKQENTNLDNKEDNKKTSD